MDTFIVTWIKGRTRQYQTVTFDAVEARGKVTVRPEVSRILHVERKEENPAYNPSN